MLAFPSSPRFSNSRKNSIRIRSFLWLAILAVASITPSSLIADESLKETVSGFRPLFNGKDMTGWDGANENYEVVDGALQCKKGKGGVLYTDEVFEDFKLQVEFQLPPAGNNGLAIRYPGKSAKGADGAYIGMCELQVLDTENPKYANIDPRQAHGSAYGMVAAKRGFLKPVGEWNYQTVEVVGSKIIVELNGTRILDADLSTVTEFMNDKPHPGKDLTSGHIGLAGHSDPVRFRRIDVMPLSK